MSKRKKDTFEHVGIAPPAPNDFHPAEDFAVSQEQLEATMNEEPRVDREQQVQENYKMAVQQHKADIHLFMSDLYKLVAAMQNKEWAFWVKERIKYWDIRLGDLKVPDR